MKTILAPLLAGLILSGCGFAGSQSAPVTPPKPTRAQTITLIPEVTHLPVPSPTDIQLPFNPDAGSNGYCKPPSAILPVEDGNDISEDKIVHELVKIWLSRYQQPAAPPFAASRITRSIKYMMIRPFTPKSWSRAETSKGWSSFPSS
jgi:hypothetical protein